MCGLPPFVDELIAYSSRGHGRPAAEIVHGPLRSTRRGSGARSGRAAMELREAVWSDRARLAKLAARWAVRHASFGIGRGSTSTSSDPPPPTRWPSGTPARTLRISTGERHARSTERVVTPRQGYATWQLVCTDTTTVRPASFRIDRIESLEARVSRERPTNTYEPGQWFSIGSDACDSLARRAVGDRTYRWDVGEG